MSVDNFDVLFAKSLSKGGGGSGTDNYNELSNKPQINGNALTGNKTGANLGLQDAITSESKLSSDLVDDTGAENLFVSSTEKSTWGGKQDAITSESKLSSDLVDDTGAENLFVSSTEKSTWGGKQDPATTLSGYGITDAYTKTETGTQITNAIGALDVSSVGGSGKYISAISETDGKISATAETMDTTPTSGSEKAVTSGAVYTALASKQDELTQAQLAAANSGITAEKLTADEAALAELTAKEQQNENNILSAYGGIVDKNVAKENDFTATLNKTVYCNPITGAIHISAANVSSTDTDSTICRILLYYTDGTVSSNNLILSRGSNISLDVNIGAKIMESIVIYASDNYNHSIGDTITVSDLMICTQADYAADPTYQPYVRTNAELTVAEDEDRAALAELVDSGAKNIQPVDIEIVKQSTTAGSWNDNVYTESGTTYTINGDGTITVDTTGLTDQSNLFLSPYLDIRNGDWVVSGCPQGGSSETYYIATNSTSWSSPKEYGDGVELDIGNNKIRLAISVKVRSGILVFKPMICTKAAWDISHKFVPYLPSWQEMYDMILALQNGTRSAPTLAKSEPEVEPETGEEEMR